MPLFPIRAELNIQTLVPIWAATKSEAINLLMTLSPDQIPKSEATIAMTIAHHHVYPPLTKEADVYDELLESQIYGDLPTSLEYDTYLSTGRTKTTIRDYLNWLWRSGLEPGTLHYEEQMEEHGQLQLFPLPSSTKTTDSADTAANVPS